MTKHPEQYTIVEKEVEEQAQAKAELLASKKQPTIVSVDNEPFSIVHRVGFKRLMNSIMAYGSTPYVGMVLKKMAATLKERK